MFFFTGLNHQAFQGVLPNDEVGGGGGGLDLTSSLEAKFGARSGQVHQIRWDTFKILHSFNLF